MNAQKTNIISYRKAWIAFVASLSCLLIYVLACVLSPPAWSPDSSKIAILVTPPGDEPDRFSIFTYDIITGTHILLDEVEADGILSAPSWSPDGKWIAYYRVEQTPEATTSPEFDATEPNQPPDKVEVSNDLLQSSETVAELASEENLMLPSFMLEMVEEHMAKEKDAESFDVKLIMVTPDAKERKTLQVMKWMAYDEIRETMVYMKPVWSPNCKRLFYVRVPGEIFSVNSIDIATGKTDGHLLSSIGTLTVSPDGKWVASYLEDENTLIAARIDGSMCRYYKLNFEVDSKNLLILDGMFWSPESRMVFVMDKESSLHAVDIASGQIEQFNTHDPNSINAYYALSSTGQELYYLSVLDSEDSNSVQQTIDLKYVNLKNGSTGTTFTLRLAQIPLLRLGMFSIAPNGKVVLARAIINDEFEEDKSVLIFCDGKTQKVIKTDRWLLKPLYSESNLTFEEKLIGNWRGEEGQMAITKGSQQRTYRLTWSEDDKEHHAVANLIQLKGMKLLGIFLDESLLENRDAYGTHLLPDTYMRIVQIEPKLLMQVIEYDKLEEILKGADEFIRPEDIGTEGLDEFERVGPLPDSSSVSEKGHSKLSFIL